MKEDKKDEFIAFKKKWLFRQVDIMIWSSFAAGIAAGAIMALIIQAI